MAGRGRNATLPAWMTGENALPPPVVNPESNHDTNANENAKFEDADPADKPRSDRSRDRRDRERGDRDREKEKERRSRSRNRKSSRAKSNSRSRSRDRKRSPDRPKGGWRPKSKSSNFDVKPPPGVELPPIIAMMGMSEIGRNGGVQPNSFNNAHHPSSASSFSSAPVGNPNDPKRDISPQHRHARRVYVGGIPPSITEAEVSAYFNDLMIRGLPASEIPTDGPPVTSVYLNLDKCFAFVEMPSIEIATACQALDGIQYTHRTGVFTLRLRRPHDYKPELVPFKNTPPLQFKLAEFQIVGTTVTDGPGKVFVGGLPYHLTDEQVKELLSAFGPLKAFNLVRDPGSVTSKGYGFCEYFDAATTALAVQSLNDMPIGEKKLTVRIAETKAPAGSQPSQSSMNMQSYNNLGMGSNPLLAGFMGLPQSNSFGAPAAIPTRILRLENMVTSQDLESDDDYADILADVQEECSQYGKVIQVVIPRAKNGYPVAAEGFIFVEFEDINGAMNGAKNLFGRKFAEKTVIVNYFDELKFQNRVYTM